MSIKYLSSSGLTEVWSNIKAYIASKIPSKIVTGLSIKGKVITYTNSDGTTGTLTTQDTNTTYPLVSTQVNGLMSATDKAKLDGIAAGANYYTHPSSHPASMITGLAKVATSGSYNDLANKPAIPAAYSLPDATATVKGGVKIGGNITVASGTISLTKANVVSALGYTPPTQDTNTTYASMSAAEATTGTATAARTISAKVLHDKINSNLSDYATKTELNNGLATKANDSAVAHLADAETISGAWSFTSTYGLQTTLIYPNVDNTYNLGESDKRYKDAYATTFHGNLVGNASSATSATKATNDSTGANIATSLANKQNNLGFTPVQQGGGYGQLGNKVKIGWTGSQLKCTVDQTNIGAFVFEGRAQVGTTITAYYGPSSSTGNKWVSVSALQGTKRVSSTSSTFTPVVGQIYSGNQLYGTATPKGGPGATGEQGSTPNVIYACLDLSGAFNNSYKYLCTTAVGVNATASIDVTGHTSYTSSGPHTTITGYSGLTKTVQGGKSTFLRVQ